MRYRKILLYRILLLLTLIFAFFSYFRVPFVFFQQDEMLSFGLAIYEQEKLILRGLFSEKVSHFIPVTNLLNLLSFKLFHLNHIAYNVVGLIIHFINSFLIFQLAKIITKRKLLAIIAFSIFLTSSVASELVMWTSVSLNMISLTFALTSFYILLKDFHTKNFTLFSGLIFSIYVLLSLLSVEYSAGLLVFYPLVFLTLFRKEKINLILRYVFPYFLIFLSYILLRLVPFFLASVTEEIHKDSHIFNSKTLLFSFVFRYIGQLIVGEYYLLEISNLIEKTLIFFFNVSLNPETQIFKLLTASVGCLVTLIAFYLMFCLKNKVKKDYKQHLFITFLLMLTSCLPFIFIPGQASDFSIFSSRYLYFGIAAYSLFIASIFKILLNVNKSFQIFGFAFTIVFMLLGSTDNYRRSYDLYISGKNKESIIREILEKYPNLPNKVVFYTESDTSYYGLPIEEKILPFQSGFGQTLLIWYFSKEKYPTNFYRDKFLWQITEEGYKEENDIGFGYFRDFQNFANKIKQNKIDLNSIIAFRYDSESKDLEDITLEIRGRVDSYLNPKNEVEILNSQIISSENNNTINLAIDNKRETYWKSETPYINKQTVQIDLTKQREIANIKIDAYNNNDQDQVGYIIYVSNDNTNWDQVFFSKRYPPNKEGMIDIYLNSKLGRYIMIEQIGGHKYSPWVIHELSIYEKIH